MRKYTRILAISLALAVTALLQSGCSGGGGGGGGSFGVYTHLSSGAWPDATVTGYADPSYLPCSQGSTGCNTSFGPVDDGSQGEYVETTDALPDDWEAAAETDSNCSSGASVGWTSVSNDGRIDLYCGSVQQQITCTINYLNNVQQNTCPTTIVITGSGYPTTYALDSGAYDTSGNGGESYQGMASSSTQFYVPAPTNWGITVLTVWDPTNNRLLAAADYGLHECYITTNDQGSSETCPY
ncbi:MAG TPA: hypothetical protein VMU92_08945 [Acidobacteriaceae bacterium]|nr:hypothetical protein [Acidobacteriaceae bacterium]